jgi:hypothetical protein
LPQVYDRLQLEIVRILHISDPDLIQLTVTAISGRQPNWLQQGKLLGQLLNAQLP